MWETETVRNGQSGCEIERLARKHWPMKRIGRQGIYVSAQQTFVYWLSLGIEIDRILLLRLDLRNRINIVLVCNFGLALA